MTFEDVEEARQREKKIRRIGREIAELNRNTLPSKTRSVIVNGKEYYTTGGASSLPSSPVETHLREVLKLEERRAELERQRETFRRMVAMIEDEEIRSIIYWRTDQLRTWEQIARIVNLSANWNTPRMRLVRYFDTEAGG